jgi:nitrous oxidase accessory protein NosD
MRHRIMWLVSCCVFVSAALGVSAEKTASIDCSKKSLADAVREATDVSLTINFTGVCTGPVVVAIDGLTLKGVGTAVIDGGGQDAVTIAGASRVALVDIDITNGLAGVVIRDGAHATLSGVTSHHNAGVGISLRNASTGRLSDVVASNNSTGLAADNGVGLTIENATVSNNTERDIALSFATRADLRMLTYGTYTCDATVLVRGTSGIVCPH